MTTTFTHRTASDAAPQSSNGSSNASGNGNGIECLCPFCGAFHGDIGRPCRHCGTEDTTAARGAARKRVGPWFVLQTKNPAAPGMSLQALLALIRGGLVTDRSVIRGPATGQLWRLAGKVRGISREFGACYGCNGDLYAADPVCPHCQRPQSLPADIDDATPEPAPVPERRPPRDDLLTPRDVAKAFSLGYGPNVPAAPGVTLNDLLPPTRGTAARPRPTLLAAVTVAAAVACFGWVVIHSLGGRRVAPAVADAAEMPAALPPAALPPVVRTTPPARSYRLPPTPATSDDLTVRPALLVHRAPAPVAVANDEPAVLTAAGSELAPDPTDDPKRLMAAGLSAEARGDYAAAVKQYERIESLSSDEWPAGLKDRVSLARAAARGD